MSSPWEYPLDYSFILRNYRRYIRDRRSAQSGLRKIKLAVLGGSTTAQLPELITAFLLDRSIDVQCFEGGYDQYLQAAMLADNELTDFAPDVIYLHTTCRNLGTWPLLTDEEIFVKQKVEAELVKYEAVWHGLHRQYEKALLIQNLFEYPSVRPLGNLDGYDYRGRTEFVRCINRGLISAAKGKPWLQLHDLDYLAARFGLDRWYDDHLWYAYKYAVSLDALVEIAHSLSILIAAQYGVSRKALVTDLDNTLWGGLIGEDGLDHIRLGADSTEGEAYADLQRYLAMLAARGIILSVASKNDETIARSGFSHPDSVLKNSDFTVFCANWEAKPDNIRLIAKQLNIGLDSFVFLDDNPVERAHVVTELPMVATPGIGSDCTNYARHLERNGWFDPLFLSGDDLNRSKYYAENVERARVAVAALSYEDYLISLEMRSTIEPFSTLYLDRLTQLINKTNQFNLTTLRLSQQEVAQMIDAPGWITLYARLVDRFGDNGLVAALAGKCSGTVLEIELWLMSCRVLKRDLEKAMLDELVRTCRVHGITNILGQYRPTEKNALVADLYAGLNFSLLGKEADGSTRWELAVADYVMQNRVIEVLK